MATPTNCNEDCKSHRGQKIISPFIYGCSKCEGVEQFRAMCNVPTYGHLCANCWEIQPESERAHFVRIISSTSAN